MKRILILLTSLLLPLSLFAQTASGKDYLRRYNNLVSRVGVSGVGVETLVDKWVADCPDDTSALLARFSFWFSKAQTSQVIQLPQDRYLGREPLLPLTDSLGRKNNYFEDILFDDEMAARSFEALDGAIALAPERLDFRFLRADALIAYEKDSPDMALSSLKALADEHFGRHPAWKHGSLEKVDDEVFMALMQDYCFTFFRLGTPSSAEAFRSLSEYLLQYDKDDPMLLDNLGSYWLVSQKNYKKALKYYNQVLKKHPDDVTAIRNAILLARAKKDVKLERKYLAMMAQYGPTETDRASASARLERLQRK